MVVGACAGGVVGTAVYGDAAAAAATSGGKDDIREHVHIDDALRGVGCDLAMGEGAVAPSGWPATKSPPRGSSRNSPARGPWWA